MNKLRVLDFGGCSKNDKKDGKEGKDGNEAPPPQQPQFFSIDLIL